MIGGKGWTRKCVEEFLGRRIYTIPCGTVPKGDDPHGRIVHDYSHEGPDGISINVALVDNSVQYIKFSERIDALSKVS